MTDEPPADTIRRAAALMRQRANDVVPGPWHVELLGGEGYPQRISNARAIVIAQTYTSPTVPPAQAEHIAALHPLVALAIADSWDATAAEMDDYPAVLLPGGVGIESRPAEPSAIWTHTHTAARAYLGERP